MAAGTGFHGPLRAAFTAALGQDPTPEAIAGVLRSPADALPVPPATQRDVWDPQTGRADRPALHDLIERADLDLTEPWPLPLASTAALVRRNGDRNTHEQLVFTRQDRLSRAVVAAAATGEDRFLDEVADGVWLLCEQSSWAWPAHDDAFAERGSVLPTVTAPYLDLGAGEVAGQLAWTDHVLGSALNERYPGLRDRVRHETRVRVIDPFLTRRDWHWLGLDGDVHNWNPWIHGNLLLAALRLLDDPAEAAVRADVIALVVEGLDRYVASLPEDGAIDEGYSYWWNGAGRCLEALDLLAHATDGHLDPVTQVPALRGTVTFPHRMHLGGDWYLNVADGQARPTRGQPWDALHRAALRVGDAEAAAHAASYRTPGEPAAKEREGLGRLLRAITDPAWLFAAAATPPLPREVWFASTQVRLVRHQAGSAAGLTLAAKGGHNGEHHNHNDVGEVVIASDGVPVVVDAGRPTYTAQTFSPERYSLWMMQSSWHSVPEVRGTPQAVDEGFRATAVTPTADGLALDLAAAYPVAGLRSWRREASLAPTQLSVHDAWVLEPWAGEGAEPATVVHYLLAGSVSLQPGVARVVPLAGAPTVELTWPADVPVSVTVRELDDPMLSDVWGERLTRLELDVTGRSELTIVAQQLREGR